MTIRKPVAAILMGLVVVGLEIADSARHPHRPAALVDDPSFGLGIVPAGRTYRHSWFIENRMSGPLRLRTRFTSGRCGFSLWLGDERVVLPGARLTVSLSCPAPDRASTPFAARVDVLTNDPEAPRLRFRVHGMTGPAAPR